MGIFSRFFKVAESEAHAVMDKLEDPIKMTEQGIRDLKKDLDSSLHSLAQSKAVLISMRKDSQQKKSIAANYEKKAILLLQKAESGELDPAEADRLATEALSKKETSMTTAVQVSDDLKRNEIQTAKLETNVKALRHNISKWENELTTLKARSKIANAQKKLNKQLSSVDSSSTVSLLEKMKVRVQEDEALAEAYGEIGDAESNVDAEIDKALAGGESKASSSLDALKLKLKSGKA